MEIVNVILYKLKTGVQWSQLLVMALFAGVFLNWQSVYRHYRKWCLSSARKGCWIKFLKNYMGELDFSSVDLNGSNTPAIWGEANVGYYIRKKRRTTNAQYLTCKQ